MDLIYPHYILIISLYPPYISSFFLVPQSSDPLPAPDATARCLFHQGLHQCLAVDVHQLLKSQAHDAIDGHRQKGRAVLLAAAGGQHGQHGGQPKRTKFKNTVRNGDVDLVESHLLGGAIIIAISKNHGRQWVSDDIPYGPYVKWMIKKVFETTRHDSRERLI